MDKPTCPDIAISRDLAERLLNHLASMQDEGPDGCGWKSDQLQSDIDALRDALQRKPRRVSKDEIIVVDPIKVTSG